MEFLLIVAVLILVSIALSRTTKHTHQIERLLREVHALRTKLTDIEEAGGISPGAGGKSTGAVLPGKPQASDPPVVGSAPPMQKAVATATSAGQEQISAIQGGDRKASPQKPFQAPGFLDNLSAANWMIIAGGVALALALGFLIKYSVEEGWLGPIARVVVGCMAGFGLLVAGEWVRRNPLGRGPAIVQNDSLPATLTGAGIIALFASIYGAYSLYGLLPTGMTFGLLVGVSLVATLLSFYHGPVIAGLGMSGAYLVPLLVGGGDPSGATLFGYLFVVTAGVIAIGRVRFWTWAPWLAFAAPLTWTILFAEVWLLDIRTGAAPDIVMLFWLGQLALMVLIPDFQKTSDEEPAPSLGQTKWQGIVSGIFAGLLILLVFTARAHTDIATFIVAAFIAGNVVLPWYQTGRIPHLMIASGMSIFTLLLWNFIPPEAGFDFEFADRTQNLPRVPEIASGFVAAAASIIALFVATSAARSLLGRSKAGTWAGIGVLTALLAFMAVYLQLVGFEHSLSWGLLAGGLALFFLAIAVLMRKRFTEEIESTALALWATGALSALSLGLAVVLERAWLTIALSLVVAGTSWVYTKVPVSVLRKLTLVLALIVMVRLLFNPFVFDYEIVRPLVFNWLLYGYGLPALLFFFASRWMTGEGTGRINPVLQAGALVFALVCISMQIRLFVHDGVLTAADYTLAEASLNTLAWSAFAYGLFRRWTESSGPVVVYGTRILMGGTLAHIFLVHGLALNPVFTGEDIGRWPVVNMLLVAYALPAILLAFFLLPWHTDRRTAFFGKKGELAISGIVAGSAFFLGLVWVSLETTRAFQGESLSTRLSGDVELYAYSLVWLIYAALFMAVGIWRQLPVFRLAAMAVIAIVTLKIFIFDMSALQGLLRVLSFFGLAVSLIGIGFLYQRFVIVEASEKPGPSEKGSETEKP